VNRNNGWKQRMVEGWAFVAVAVIAFAGGLLIGDLASSPGTETVYVQAPSDGGEEAGAAAEAEGAAAGGPEAESPGSEGEAEAAGAQIFASAGCGACHTLAAAGSSGQTGPNLDEFLAPDDNTEAVEEMIVDPNAELAEGYSASVMPQNYSQSLSPGEVSKLAEYLVETTPAKP
jgi:mono/diheme cytochrome c family protein